MQNTSVSYLGPTNVVSLGLMDLHIDLLVVGAVIWDTEDANLLLNTPNHR